MPLPVLFILITVVIDAMGIGLILPVMPDLIQSVEGPGLASAALWGGILTAAFAVNFNRCGAWRAVDKKKEIIGDRLKAPIKTGKG